MTVKERIKILALIDKIEKYPSYSKDIGIYVIDKEKNNGYSKNHQNQ